MGRGTEERRCREDRDVKSDPQKEVLEAFQDHIECILITANTSKIERVENHHL